MHGETKRSRPSCMRLAHTLDVLMRMAFAGAGLRGARSHPHPGPRCAASWNTACRDETVEVLLRCLNALKSLLSLPKHVHMSP